jgi:uncharacterized spore protein YtfJ
MTASGLGLTCLLGAGPGAGMGFGPLSFVILKIDDAEFLSLGRTAE